MADYQRYANGPLKGGSPTLRFSSISSVLGRSCLNSSLLRCACTYLRSSDNLRFYLPSRAFASIRKITPQAIPRLYNGICSLYVHPKSSCLATLDFSLHLGQPCGRHIETIKNMQKPTPNQLYDFRIRHLYRF